MAKKRKKITLEDVHKEIQTIKRRQNKIMKFEEEQVKRETKIANQEKEELKELESLKNIEKKLKKAVGRHPLRKITYKDIAKGSIGAFVGVAAHYGVYYGVKIAHNIDVIRATIIFILAYVVGGVFLYITGYRKLKVKTIAFLPLRLTMLYTIAIIISFLLLSLFEPQFLSSFEETYKQIATVTLSATIGACTADLIGSED